MSKTQTCITQHVKCDGMHLHTCAYVSTFDAIEDPKGIDRFQCIYLLCVILLSTMRGTNALDVKGMPNTVQQSLLNITSYGIKHDYALRGTMVMYKLSNIIGSDLQKICIRNYTSRKTYA